MSKKKRNEQGTEIDERPTDVRGTPSDTTETAATAETEPDSEVEPITETTTDTAATAEDTPPHEQFKPDPKQLLAFASLEQQIARLEKTPLLPGTKEALRELKTARRAFRFRNEPIPEVLIGMKDETLRALCDPRPHSERPEPQVYATGYVPETWAAFCARKKEDCEGEPPVRINEGSAGLLSAARPGTTSNPVWLWADGTIAEQQVAIVPGFDYGPGAKLTGDFFVEPCESESVRLHRARQYWVTRRDTEYREWMQWVQLIDVGLSASPDTDATEYNRENAERCTRMDRYAAKVREIDRLYTETPEYRAKIAAQDRRLRKLDDARRSRKQFRNYGPQEIPDSPFK